jgi:hypothetical protein
MAMEVSSVASLSGQVAQMKLGDAVGISVLKKAIDIEAQGVLQLLRALPQPASNPPHLGNGVDVTA